jgi:hypothetical protein
MPLTHKGQTIKAALQKEYGKEKGASILYAGKNKGTFTGIDAQSKYMDACRRGDAVAMRHCADQILRGRIVR